jgi:hypothetical protein
MPNPRRCLPPPANPDAAARPAGNGPCRIPRLRIALGRASGLAGIRFSPPLVEIASDRARVIWPAARRLGSLAAVALAACLSAAFVAPTAQAAVTHAFLPEPSKALALGVPESATPEEASVKGPLGDVHGLATDAGRVWIADRLGEPARTRVDAFDGESGAFVPPQLREEAGVSNFESGVAVGHGSGEEEVYVGAGHDGEPVIAVFGPSARLQAIWTGAHTPTGSFSNREGERISVITGVAVDHSTNLETSGKVYVATNAGGATKPEAFDVVDVFAPQAGGTEPAGTVTQLTGTCETTGTSCAGEEVVPFVAPTGVAVSGFNGDVFVTDASKAIDVFEPTVLGQYRFVQRLTGTPTGRGGEERTFQHVTAVAVDGANGDIYAVDQGSEVVDQFDLDGNYVGSLTGTPAGPFHSLLSVAVDPQSEDVFVSALDREGGTGPVDVFGPDIEIPDVRTKPASDIAVTAAGAITATFNGEVNPDGAGEATCRFAWGSGEAFGHFAPCEPEAVPNGEGYVPVQAKVGNLAPDTSYVYRLQASNASATNPGSHSDDEVFTTPGPGIRSESASDVTSTSVDLEASVNPHEAPTAYYFQYGKDSSYETSLPIPPGASIGAGAEDVPVAQHVQGLVAGATYHYRVVAVSELEVEGRLQPVAFGGPDKAFTTHPATTASVLLDGRRWEQVSPVDKHGAFLLPIAETGVIQAAASGGAISYLASIPTEEQAIGNRGGVQIVSDRGTQSWSSQDVQLPHSEAAGGGGSGGHDYRVFSPDLSAAVVEELTVNFTSLAPQTFPPDTEQTPYIRHNATCGASPATCFEPLLTGASGYADVPEGTRFGGLEEPFVAASHDLAHVVLSSGLALTDSPISSKRVLYEWNVGAAPSDALQLVSILPDGQAATKQALLGFTNHDARNAISDDGSKVVWSEDEGHLYLRDMANEQTLQLDLPEAECVAQHECGTGEVNPQFQGASKDDSRIFFTDSQRLTKGSGARTGQPDLYVCEVETAAGEDTCKLTDLTVSQTEPADVQGKVLGTSEDGNWVYYVADGALTADATKGTCRTHEPSPPGARCNLYVTRRDGSGWHAPSLVQVISGDDFPDWGGNLELPSLTARVSLDGRWLAFMSDLPLTGYDTRDAASGQPDEEVYLFHAEAEAPGSVVCASCDPSGARPAGVEYQRIGRLAGGDSVWKPTQWIAANVPGWTPYRIQTARYQSRYLSDQGRLFFNSSDALAPRDVNGDEDVYEFEPVGVGDCSPSSTVFNPATGGCVALVSSGRAAGESAFMDASESGDDVFFLTRGQLSASDTDTAVDLYDAHGCSTAAPCFSEPSPPPPCATADSCRAAPTPQPSIFGQPSSATFSGTGNVAPAPAHPRALTRAEKLRRALRACHAVRPKHRRAACERRARRRYGPKSSRSRRQTK